jgi:DNA recombination protein RmuC
LDAQGQKSLESVKDVRSTVDKQLKEMREDNGKRLDEMRKTVDEKLQTTLEKRLGESFKQVSDRLEQVHKGLGEMQTLASGVGDLKKVLTNVKTKGILGEYQLANILEQMLPREQYEENIATRPGSAERVEFAVRMPGTNDNESIWLPIDSKFPLKGYEDLLDAREAGDLAAIKAAEKALARTIESFAKDISEKYLEVPYTTEFGIMFLPVESLYAEVLRHPGVFETLQRKYHITITGPTTMSALLAVTKRSSEVWRILEAVKTEFGKFSEQLEKVDDRLGKAKNELEKLRSTRTNVMARKLREVGTLDSGDSAEVLELPNLSEAPAPDASETPEPSEG